MNYPKCILPERSFELTLEDCLACSGCLTNEKEIINLKSLKSEKIDLIISEYVIFDFYHKFKNEIKFDKFVNLFFEKLKNIFLIENIFLTNFVKEMKFENNFKKLENNKEPLIISECPGIVTYFEKRRPDLLPFLDKNLTNQQILYFLSDENQKNKNNSKKLFVMMCSDKKLEDLVNFDFFMTAKDLEKILLEEGGIIDSNKIEIQTKSDNFDLEYNSKSIFLEDPIFKQSFISYIIKNKKYEISEKLEINSFFKIYTLKSKNKNLKVAQITGLKNLLNFLNNYKDDSIYFYKKYDLIDIFLCEKRCSNGPGLVNKKYFGEFYDEYLNILNKFIENVDLDKNILLKERKFVDKKRKVANFKVDW